MPNTQNLSTEPMGPEAEQLIVALQSYISSIIRGRSQTDNSNTISRIAHFEEFDTAMNSNAPESQTDEDEEAESESVVANNITSNPDDKQTRRLGEMLDDLQENVFNDIPIRLLSFESPINLNP
ncbi:hypothetical protein BDN70DRAFT_360491 [Pholiota conissans]|uniref:Uncharacterized protein n=1 Tax=Pholiota conissans TaxID=109636 RepID=A0A9P6D4Y4_9AGAR|nr:hypothetical protein BDN70DRAFT_360491 [Pholiota conissans]